MPRRAAASSIGCTATWSRPVLWKKVQTGLSAGRVQSVAVRLIVEREEERGRSAAAPTGTSMRASGRRRDTFVATLVRVGDDASPAARTSTRDRRARKAAASACSTKPPPRRCATRCRSAAVGGDRVEEKPTTQRPSAPFTTSTLQQEANRKLGFSADRTMSAAQRLFQEGVISYHRTDSTTLSEKALRESRGRSGTCTATLSTAGPAVPDEGQERPGSARSDPADRLRPAAAIAVSCRTDEPVSTN